MHLGSLSGDQQDKDDIDRAVIQSRKIDGFCQREQATDGFRAEVDSAMRYRDPLANSSAA